MDTTFIEGQVYFDRERDLQLRKDIAREKADRLKKEADEEAKNKHALRSDSDEGKEKKPEASND